MAKKSSLGFLIVVLILGGMIGTVLGEIFGTMIGSGFFHRLFSEGVKLGTNNPVSLDLGILQFTLGIALKLNLMGVVGIVSALVLTRKFA